MQLIKFLVPFSAFIMPSYLAGIIIKKTVLEEHSTLAEAAVEILTTCYRNRGDGVVLAGSSAGNISRMLWTRLYLPVTILDNAMRAVRNPEMGPCTAHRLQVFVVTASSSKTLTSTLNDIKYSPWWDHMASVIILDWSVSKRGCAKAIGILRGAWKMNLLYTKFMCLDRMQRTLLYSYNPYTSQAPHPWQLVTVFSRKNHHPWYLFAQIYQPGKEICNELDFKKTNNLAGYKIRLIAKNVGGMWSTELNENGADSFAGLDGKIATLLLNALNVTSSVVTINITSGSVPLSFENNIFDRDVDIRKGVFDMGINTRFPDGISKLSRPVRESGLVVMTQYRGHMSQIAKIAAVIDTGSKIGTLLVALITLLFFKYVVGQALMSAFLNVWRIYCSTCVPKVPKTQASRLYLLTVLFFMIHLRAIYEGKLSALVTKKVAIPDVETIQDINKFGLTVYGGARYLPDFREVIIKEGFVIISGANCTGKVLSDYRAACVHDKYLLTHEAAEFGLHVSGEPILKVFRMYFIRPDWPLENRLNEIIGTLVESGLVEYSDKLDTQQTLRILEMHEELHGDQGFKIMTLEELLFAFCILGIGLSCATASFIVEIAIEEARLKIAIAKVNVRYWLGWGKK